jgi:hypothetical protein
MTDVKPNAALRLQPPGWRLVRRRGAGLDRQPVKEVHHAGLEIVLGTDHEELFLPQKPREDAGANVASPLVEDQLRGHPGVRISEDRLKG